MRKIFSALFSSVSIFLFAGCTSQTNPESDLIKYGPYSHDSYGMSINYDESISFKRDGTYSYSYYGDVRVEGDNILTYDTKTENAKYSEVLIYEYEYITHGKVDKNVARNDNAWIAIYKLDGCRNYWTENFEGSLFVALDGNTSRYGKITLFLFNDIITTSYLDSLRPDMSSLVGGKDYSGYIPLNQVGQYSTIQGNTHININGKSTTLVNESNKEG